MRFRLNTLCISLKDIRPGERSQRFYNKFGTSPVANAAHAALALYDSILVYADSVISQAAGY